jgi:hypothetical protein
MPRGKKEERFPLRSDGNWVIYRLLNHLHVDGLLALGAVADLEFDVLTFVERLETIR